MLNFVTEVVTQYTISSNCVRAAVIRYGSIADVRIQLNQYSDVNRLVQAISQIPLSGGSSNLADALNMLQSTVFAGAGTTARVVVIVTDQLQPSTAITNAANSVKSQGIRIVAVGIGGVDTNYMYQIVSNRLAVLVSSYSQLVPSARNTVVGQQYACPQYIAPTPARM